MSTRKEHIMAITAGYSSTITAGGTAVKDIMSIDYSAKVNMDDTTGFSGTTPGTETNIPTTFAPTSIKLSGKRNAADTGQNALRTAYRARTTVAIVYSPNATETFSGSYWVTDFNTKTEPKKAVSLDITLMLDGVETVV
jgi:hypothetical protein